MKTTREAAREASHNKLVELLTSLLEKNYDAKKGYKNAIEHTKNPELKHFYRNQAAQRNHFATELDKEIHMLNEHPRDHDTGSTLANLHRVWMNLKSSLGKKDDKAILQECLRGEKASLKEYEEKIEHTILSPRIKELLENQRDKIRETITEIDTLL